MRTKISISLILFLLVFELRAQKTESFNVKISDLDYEQDTTFVIPGLQTFIDSALVNSPLLAAKYTEVEQARVELDLKKKSWTDYITFDGNTRYGVFNYGNILLNNQTYSPGTENEQFNYYFGLTLKMPVSGIVSRGDIKKVAKLKVNETQFLAEQLKNEIKMAVVEQYYKLMALKGSMEVYSRVAQTTLINYKKSILDVQLGKVSVEQFTIITSAYGQSVDNYLKTKNEFLIQYHKLQIISGIKF